MAYTRPTLSELQERAKADIEAAQPGTDALLRFSPLRILGRVLAALINLVYGYLDYIAKQAVPWTATDEYLAAWGALKKVYQKAATKSASSAVTFPATSGTISAGTQLVRGDGVLYVTTTSGTSSGTAITVAAEAVDAGEAGNCDAGTKLTLATAVDGVQSTGVATAAFVGGADVESQDDFSARVMAGYQASPQGGSVDDYSTWATAKSGVTRAWANPVGFGAGTVVVYFMMDDVEVDHDGFPQGTNGVATAEKRNATKATGDQLILANALYTLRPATALVYACSPEKHILNFKISGLSSASTATRAAISAALADALYRNGTPLEGTVDRTEIEGALSGISAAAGGVIDEIDGVIDATTTVITGNVVSPLGYLPTLGTVTYL
jgi:uncharacterized phage protein gp47/JayE